MPNTVAVLDVSRSSSPDSQLRLFRPSIRHATVCVCIYRHLSNGYRGGSTLTETIVVLLLTPRGKCNKLSRGLARRLRFMRS